MLTRQTVRFVTRQRGQILPLALWGVVLAAVVLILLTNVGNKVTEKSVVVNAADAAAYSGAVYVARHLNYMAYTNRAMIANHVGVGHFVAYMSWIRYVEEVADRIDDIAQFFPIINAAAEAVEQFATLLRELAEIEGEIYIPAVDALNRFYHLAQLEAHATLATNQMEELMQATAERFDPVIQVNNDEALSKLDATIAAPLQAAIAFQKIAVPAFIKPLEVTDRSNELVALVENTYGGGGSIKGLAVTQGNMSRKWLTDRGWSVFIGLTEIEKEFKTRHTLNNELADWNTTDKLVKREFFGLFGDISETTLAGEKASAREFASEYRGITGYYGLVNPSSDDYTLSIVAYTSKDQTQVATQDAFGFESSEIPLSGLSVAQVEHRRPKIDFNPLSTFRLLVGEYSNLYNPFWQARLVGVDELDLAEILKQVKQQFPQGTL